MMKKFFFIYFFVLCTMVVQFWVLVGLQARNLDAVVVVERIVVIAFDIVALDQ